jgi:hypothetical protein
VDAAIAWTAPQIIFIRMIVKGDHSDQIDQFSHFQSRRYQTAGATI